MKIDRGAVYAPVPRFDEAPLRVRLTVFCAYPEEPTRHKLNCSTARHRGFLGLAAAINVLCVWRFSSNDYARAVRLQRDGIA